MDNNNAAHISAALDALDKFQQQTTIAVILKRP